MALIVLLAAYDIGRAATIRCVQTSDKERVLALDEMDQLPGKAPLLTIETVDGRFQHVGGTVVLGPAASLAIGALVPNLWRDHGRPGLFADVDGHERVQAQSDSTALRYSMKIPNRLLPRGKHRIDFIVVPSDLRGYYRLENALTVIGLTSVGSATEFTTFGPEPPPKASSKSSGVSRVIRR